MYKKNLNNIAVLIPCYNEEATISKVVSDFKKVLPKANIFVFDNNSTDNTKKLAIEAGATVIPEVRQGKGWVVQSMFEKIDADIYVMTDGDDTYPSEHVHKLLKPIEDGTADMVVSNRLKNHDKNSFPQLHKIGNKMITKFINILFRSKIKDMLSGYRAFSKAFVKSIPIMSKGFEIETELTLQALEKNFVIKEIILPYNERPPGSYSKLSTFKDGFRILFKIISIFINYYPLLFFSMLGIIFNAIGLFAGSIVVYDYFEDYYVDKVPTTIFAVSSCLFGFLLISVGIILYVVNNKVKELEIMIRKIK